MLTQVAIRVAHCLLAATCRTCGAATGGEATSDEVAAFRTPPPTAVAAPAPAPLGTVVHRHAALVAVNAAVIADRRRRWRDVAKLHLPSGAEAHDDREAPNRRPPILATCSSSPPHAAAGSLGVTGIDVGAGSDNAAPAGPTPPRLLPVAGPVAARGTCPHRAWGTAIGIWVGTELIEVDTAVICRSAAEPVIHPALISVDRRVLPNATITDGVRLSGREIEPLMAAPGEPSTRPSPVPPHAVLVDHSPRFRVLGVR